jgi:tRNA (cmo5U34)-methyltransferase
VLRGGDGSLTAMGQFHWDPDGYLGLMHAEVADYEHLQDETAAAAGSGASRLLELGTGTGETARRVLARNPSAFLVGLDASGEMLAQRTPRALPADRVDLCIAALSDPLPDGSFDVVFSALTVHHLDGAGKADLFGRFPIVGAGGGPVPPPATLTRVRRLPHRSLGRPHRPAARTPASAG